MRLWIMWLGVNLLILFSAAAVRAKGQGIPWTGEHILLTFDFANEKPKGISGNLRFDGGLVLNRGSAEGEFVSQSLKLKGYNQAILSWAADTPDGTWLLIRYRIRSRGMPWSRWFDMGAWGTKYPFPRETLDPEYGELQVDMLKAARIFNEIQYKIEFHGNRNLSPTLRRVSIALSMVSDEDKTIPDPGPSVKGPIELDVPWLSQLRMDHVGDQGMIDARVCAPTSVAMVLKYFGVRTSIMDVGRIELDPVAKIYGNWALMAATGASFGLDAWVERHKDWTGIERRLAQGTPVIISIAFEKGTFSSQPERRSKGHIMVIRGITAKGDFIVNDPGTAFQESGDGVVLPREELARAFFGHGGVAIIIRGSKK